MKLNDFNLDLTYSLEERENDIFDDFYKRIFPGLVEVKFVDNLALQKMGVDKILRFKSGNIVTIDEKKRRLNYSDIALELRHEYDNGTTTRGWLYKSQCDYIVYAIMPRHKVYILPTFLLKRAWWVNKSAWHNFYSEIRARNNGYYSISLPIPTNTLLDAITREMRHDFV